MIPDPDPPIDDDRIARIDQTAVALVGAVRDRDPAEVRQLVAGLDPVDLAALAISLAAMVDPDRTVGQLLDWIEPDHPHDEDELRLAHAAYARGDRDSWTVRGERTYQRNRKRRHRTERHA
ncbi:hypothetical protein G4X40_20255 [Rhodococcus sp. D2-41]|uniref:hypothetical protein n=1 Tax=Speluncibacter jeojiensis TaxID=2710754 RepID=UPI00240F4D60|nr:hypothetical protein [Rhodococcus sp. D2-41]MDG3012476.1 hypothetical protein [Rhodococcus sp. D2-41]